MKRAAGARHTWSSPWLDLLLAAPVASAQTGAKPMVPATPSGPLTATTSDTARPVPQRTRTGVRFVFRQRGPGTLTEIGRRMAVRSSTFCPTAGSSMPPRPRVDRSGSEWAGARL